MEKVYNVVFRGKLAPDTDIDSAKEKMAKLFRINADAVAQMFARESVNIKSNISENEAKRYKIAIAEQVGLICSVEPIDNSGLSLIPLDNRPKEIAFKCPSCDTEETITTSIEEHVCSKCGLVAEKFEAKKKENEERERIRQSILKAKQASQN